jgi:predicted nuclease of predicted toxin-antitoxin system
MKFLIDESSGRAIVDFLRQAGHDVLSVAEESLGSTDLAVVSFAENTGRILVTNDKDFGDLVIRSKARVTGLILLRLQDESRENRVRVIGAVLSQVGDTLMGHLVVASDWHIRIRSLENAV